MRDLIDKELAFSCGVIRDGHEVVPRFLINTPDGGYTIFCPLPDSIEVRFAHMNLVSRFMVYRMATSFVMSSELEEPDAVSSVFVRGGEAEAGVRLIERDPLKFSSTMWLDAEQIGDEVPSLLPSKFEELSAAEIHDIDTAIKAFSANGIENVG